MFPDVWKTLFKNPFLKWWFWNHLWPVCKQQTLVFNGNWVIILNTIWAHLVRHLCVLSPLFLSSLHVESICKDLISPTQSEHPMALISPTSITPLTDPSDYSQRSLPHNRSPRHWLLNPVPLKILTNPSKSVFYTLSLQCITKPCSLPRNAKPNRVLFLDVNGDEDCAWIWFSALRKEKG